MFDKVAKLAAQHVLEQEVRAFTGPDGRCRGVFRDKPDPKRPMPVAAVDNLGQDYLETLKDTLLPKAVAAYKKVRGTDPDLRPLKVEWDKDGKVPDESIARHHFTDGESTITIRPKAGKDLSYLEWVMTHELIHYLLNTPDSMADHGLEFTEMADYLKIPKKYQD